MKIFYDVLVVGTGVAGLNTALNLEDSHSILVVSKDYAWECNTFYAQGGIAVPISDEDVFVHIKDTLEAGDGHCNPDAVEILCSEARQSIQGLIDKGFQFDCDEKGKLLYTREAAHSCSRILHAGGDATGRFLHLFMMKKLKSPILYNTQVTDLLISDGKCFGVRVSHGGSIFNIYAKNVVIASGGVGSLYEYHTNARTISADMHGICLNHSIPLADMEMMQFHPTAFVQSSAVRKQLLSESLRGEGAKVVDKDGRRFLFDYDSRGELSARNIVSRAIFDYKQRTGKEVYLDLSGFESSHFRERFPSIYYNMKVMGYDLPNQKIPVSPAFHYAMGGIKTDLNCAVEGVENLFAVGEAANTGVHGANRLASNSLLEGLVFSDKVAKVLKKSQKYSHSDMLFCEKEDILMIEGDKLLKNELRSIMWKYAGIIRNGKELEKALIRVEDMLRLPIGKLLRLRLLTSREIIKSALNRKVSLGAHYIRGENG
ncbi:MAG: L-aspartate oxidase [Sulfurospirillaceae bacterium]|nr:L-aspartate oxidase [Sulfurospirillaceae bacterium]